MSKSESSPFPTASVAALILGYEGKILTVFNAKWGSYTLPMTKRREWNDPNTDAPPHWEDWADAVMRARADCIHGSSLQVPSALTEVRGFKESGRDGIWRSYDFHVFHQQLQETPKLAQGANVEWLSLEEIADLNRRPLSKSCREIVSRVQAHCTDQGTAFP